MRPIAAPAPASTSPGAPTPTAVSPWHSPVPYLFGGLAAMLGLIALALLILACSYWKLNSYLGTGHASSSGAGAGPTDGDGSKSPAAAAAASPAAFAGLVFVVMAGEKMPTFLAAPVVRRAGTDTAAALAAGEGSPETTEECKNRGNAEDGAVTAPGGERSQRVDQV